MPEGNELGSLYIGKTACQAWVIIPVPWKKEVDVKDLIPRASVYSDNPLYNLLLEAVVPEHNIDLCI